MKSNLLNRVMIVFIFLHLFLPMSLSAVEIAPRISDREIIEKLVVLEEGQKAIRTEMKSGQEALRTEMKSAQEALNKRLDDLNKRQDDSNNTMLVLFGSLITLIVALFGYIAWDRRTMVKPVIEQVNRLERKILDDLDLEHSDGSLLRRQLEALRQYAGKNPEFAEILRGLALL
ncbi:hypothetical protein [Desulfobacter postgatei]|uniref:Uncharacterized protein n=1 Tax=Desulfobacter postgatei 2ac9 TaxID=879212 RepID=I5B1Q4_9BACT|nr:hypothetical protein [Desulfobacter postgatei]EIM63417.1 hypothetical protein DespoDRAFT_01478 [Desulfobacter postgatei 2ac9]